MELIQMSEMNWEKQLCIGLDIITTGGYLLCSEPSVALFDINITLIFNI